jgi:arylsulfatase A-like enzyme
MNCLHLRHRFILISLLLALGLHAGEAQSRTQTQTPNILLILADDLGFSDLGCYGGEIATPHLDALAREGLRFSQFYNTARCWPSRAALLTGYYAQQVRRDTVPGIPSGMQGSRPSWAPLLSERLRGLGYRSYHSGKWHMDGLPIDNGFDHSYSLNDHDRYFAPQNHTEDDRPLPPVTPGSGYYASTAIADHAIRFLRDHASRYPSMPFFSFVAFTAPHFPVQAPPEDIVRYRDRFLDGWDVLREQRWNRMQALGIGGSALSAIERTVGPPYDFPDALKQLGIHEVNRAAPWMSLTPAQQRFQADKMAVHAAMVDRMDREIGRILEQVRAMDATQKTIVLFLSDNGASAEMMVRGDGHDPDAACGTGATFLSIGPGWSSLANTPFRRHKTWVHEGGISTPLIIRWPQGISTPGQVRNTPGHIVDIVPTLLESIGVRASHPGLSSAPVAPGISLVPIFPGDGPVRHETLWWQHEGNKALRRDQWKIVASGEDSPWELYDLSTDRSESRNLAGVHPELVLDLSAQWQKEASDYARIARQEPSSPYPGWRHSGTLHILTTEAGADLPASTVLEGFPLLVRLNRDFFDFRQAKARGEDIRFATASGRTLPCQVTEWDPAQGTASIWVQLPMIRGQEQRELRLYWGNPNAGADATPVFDASNGYLSVWHLGDDVRDETGTLEMRDEGTTIVPGLIGRARHFAGGQGITGGENILNYPTGNAPHSTEAWVRLERANTTLFGWGNEGGGRGSKVRMQVRSPAHLHIDSDFCDVNGDGRLPFGEWIHILHTYDGREGRIYINGHPDGVATRHLDIKSPARLWIGGWYGQYDFVGDIDEARISLVARSADWARMEYESQKPFQSAVGMLEHDGRAFSVTPESAEVQEGGTIDFTATAGGVRKLYWVLRKNDTESVLAVDRTHFTFRPGRVAGDQNLLLRVRAVGDGVQTNDIPIRVRESIPDPIIHLKAPPRWDGRTPIELTATLDNARAIEAAGATNLHWTWGISNLAVIHEDQGPTLRLLRSQKSGPLTLTVSVHNGGEPVVRSVTLEVSEPNRDPWVQREPLPEEKPEDNQFYSRDDRNQGLLVDNGTSGEVAGTMVLRVTRDGRTFAEQRQVVPAHHAYSFSVLLRPGLFRYAMVLGLQTGGKFKIIHSATNLVCGDAYVLQGQSNAVATDWGDDEPEFHSEWIRTFGSMSGDTDGFRGWGRAVHRQRENERFQIGYWGMELARRLVEAEQMPICILNGAVGGTRIDQHLRNPINPVDTTTIYGRLLWRAREARLTHGIRGIFWYQGENDQGADGPSGGFGWENYRRDFLELAAAWKQDFPNVQHYHVFQIWPKACSMGFGGSDNQLREVQRNLPSAFSHLSVMSTLGVDPAGGCHFPSAGYADLARLVFPWVESEQYHRKFPQPVTPPNLLQARAHAGDGQTLELLFDQPVIWNDELAADFRIDGKRGAILSARTSGNVLLLRCTALSPGVTHTVSYLDGEAWDPHRLLRGKNGLAALTFWQVPTAP